jgi:hypothetical protein
MTPTPLSSAAVPAPGPAAGPEPSPRRTSGRQRSGPRRAVVLLVATGLLIAACGGDDTAKWADDMVSSPAPMPAPAFPSAPPMSADEAGVTREGGDAGAFAPIDAIDTGRAVIRNASIELIVDDGAAAIEQVIERATLFGGYVSSTFLSRAEDGTVSGSLTLRVPTDQLDALVDALDALARSVPYRSVDESDVTLQLSDLDARIANLRAFERELLELLTEVRERDGTVEGLVAVADRLREVRTEIDVIEGRRRQLADQVALSAVYVSVQQARSTTPVVGTWDLPGVVRDALAATLRLGQLAVEGVVWIALTVLPALIVVLVAVRVVTVVRRRRRQRLAAEGAPGSDVLHG